jgi:hypothetical protein
MVINIFFLLQYPRPLQFIYLSDFQVNNCSNLQGLKQKKPSIKEGFGPFLTTGYSRARYRMPILRIMTNLWMNSYLLIQQT